MVGTPLVYLLVLNEEVYMNLRIYVLLSMKYKSNITIVEHTIMKGYKLESFNIVFAV